jgi:hypothetical protein
MRAPGPTFAEAVDAFKHRYPDYAGWWFLSSRVRQFTHRLPTGTVDDYMELIGSICVAWLVAQTWPRLPEQVQQYRQEANRRLDLIRPLLKESWLTPVARQELEQLERCETAFVNDCNEGTPPVIDAMPIDGVGLPKRRDHLTVDDLGRERRGAGPCLFVRELSLAMRDIFGKPYDKVVGELAGLAFETKALSLRTVRAMCEKTTTTRPK